MNKLEISQHIVLALLWRLSVNSRRLQCVFYFSRLEPRPVLVRVCAYVPVYRCELWETHKRIVSVSYLS